MWCDYQRARAVIEHYLTLDFDKWSWDKMVGRAECNPLGCMLQCIDTQIPTSRWLEASFYIGRELRRRYPFKLSASKSHDWASEIEPILELIVEKVRDFELLPSPTFDETEFVPLETSALQPSGFVTWRLFRRRHPAPDQPGIYLFGYFDGLPDAEVDPLSRNVIYIGYSGHQKNRRTIAQRLDEFERTAHDEIGHSAGWTYRTEFVKDWPSLVLFRNTFISWKAYSRESDENPRELEKSLIAAYRSNWGKRLLLNKAN